MGTVSQNVRGQESGMQQGVTRVFPDLIDGQKHSTFNIQHSTFSPELRTPNTEHPGCFRNDGGFAAIRVLFALALLLLGAGAALFFHRMFPPEPVEQEQTPASDYSSAALLAAVAPAAVEDEMARILDLGSRFMGQPGAYALENLIRERYTAAGLEVLEQENYCAVPVTKRREVFANGQPLPDVEIFPFMPNHLQPMNTPAEGLTGELVVIDDDALTTRKNFDGCIGLIDAREDRVPTGLDFLWSRYARLGLTALIVSHPDGLDQMPWDRIGGGEAGMVSTLPVNFVRLAATPEIFQHTGREVTLHVRTAYENTRHTTLIGIMRATKSDGKSALILSSDYDACSVLPDRAPGGMQALSPALHLSLLDALQSYREQLRRDVIFISFGGQMMGHDGKYNLLRVLGPNAGDLTDQENPVLRALGREARTTESDVGSTVTPARSERARANDQALKQLQTIRRAMEDSSMFASEQSLRTTLAAFDQTTRTFFNEQILYVLNGLVLELSEPALQAKIDFESRGADIAGADFKTYQTAKSEYETVMAAAGLPLDRIVKEKQAFLSRYGVEDRWRKRFGELSVHHEREARRLAQDQLLIERLGAYREKMFIHPYLAPDRDSSAAGEELTFLSGSDVDTQPKTFSELLTWAKQKRGFDNDQLVIHPYDRNHDANNRSFINGTPQLFIGAFGESAGYAFFAPINRNRGPSYVRYAYPVTLPYMTNLHTLTYSLEATGETVLTLAMGTGAGKFSGRTARFGLEAAPVNLGGRVLVANVGQSMVPNFPLAGALITGAREPYLPIRPGFFQHPFYFADPYGRYDVPYHIFNFSLMHTPYSPVAAGFGEDGIIRFMKDEGPSGQRLFKSTGISSWVKEIFQNVTIVTFRAGPFTLLDLMNPQTMREYSGVELIDRQGLAPMEKFCKFPMAGVQEGIHTTFVPPDEVVFVKLLSGTPDNEFANETRTFLLNVSADFRADPEREIDGRGFVVRDHPLVRNAPADAARSMAMVNEKRLDLQQRHHMSDDRTAIYHDKSLELIGVAESGALSFTESARKARESITYSILNHPVLRRSIFEAVLGILWYLGLLVPFVFFFEKLVFGFTDIRKQLLAQGAVFIIVFILLNILHPAFAMVRSSLMILLGFVIMLISGGVTLMSSGKFHENLEELRKKSGKVTAADVNTMSAIGSAFMLGLNNMHRRKLRTGLTCATLVLMTFVMICFTSVQSDLVDRQITLGKAKYQGFLIKKERFRSMTDGEVFALNQEYGHVHDVCPRVFLIGGIDQDNYYRNPRIDGVVNTRQGVTRSTVFASALTFNDRDPVQHAIDFTTKKTWFSKSDCVPSDNPPPVMISSSAAENLGISPEDVEAGRAEIIIASQPCRIIALFDADSLDALSDLDGQSLLPFDIDSMDSITSDATTWQVLADEDSPRISARDVVIFPHGRDPDSLQDMYSRKVTASTAVAMPGLPYPEARNEIEAYMERSARSVFYGLDGMAYLGKRTRETSLGGLLDMLIPLIIAAMVVLNTIRGSVYERKDEIYVYNAVGIAPRYVFFMFFAEAIVYSVVGAVLGYLLSQGVGRILTELDMTGGMNMTFTSISTIYASLAIAAATFISTIFPALTAMEIATPAEDAGWKVPEPDGDSLRFDLPFTFTHHDRIAVLAFFHRYLGDHGEGSSGRFYAGPPVTGIADRLDPLADQAYIPQIKTTIWLKPFDLSVSQEMIISLPTDRETGEYIAHIELVRLSGTKESWMRLNQGFLAQIRKHFLHWRAVSDQDREEMFAEARELLEQGSGVRGQGSGVRSQEAESRRV